MFKRPKIDVIGIVVLIAIAMVVLAMTGEIRATLKGHPLSVPAKATNVKSLGRGWYSWDLEGHSFIQDTSNHTVTKVK